MSSDVLAPPGPEINEGSLSAQDDRELQCGHQRQT